MMSPAKMSIFSPTKTAAKKKKKADPDMLNSPTSDKMKNSYIIKNADQSFDTYFTMMRRRKPHQETKVEMEASSYGSI